MDQLNYIELEDLEKIKINFCLVTKVDKILKNPKKEFNETDNPVKAYKLSIVPPDSEEEITVVTNIVHYSEFQLEGKKLAFVLNLKPVVIRGFESRGMIFMIDDQIVEKNK